MTSMFDNNATQTQMLDISEVFKTMGNANKVIDEFKAKLAGTQSLQNLEEVEPVYANPAHTSAYNKQSVYRFNQNGQRYYFTMINGEVTFAPSVTTIISNSTPMSYGLKKILADKGMEGFNDYMREKADYGTLMHILIADYLSSGNSHDNRHFNFDTIEEKIAQFVKEKNIAYSTQYWQWQMKKDIASLIQFIIDYNVEPIAIELVGTWDNGEYRFAGAIDLLCLMNIREKGFWGEVYKSGERKGEPKESYQERRVKAIVDFKSGKSGFFEDHEIQLHMYKMIAQDALGFNVEKVFNVAPKDWIGATPTYDVKDQTNSTAAQKIPFLLGQFYVDWREPKDLQIISGTTNGQGLSEAVKLVPAKEYAKMLVERKKLSHEQLKKEYLNKVQQAIYQQLGAE